MDICLLNTNNTINLRPTSVHGMLWLQTHFENSQWEAISSFQAVLSMDNADILLRDAKKAGLVVNSFPSMVYSNK